MREKRRNTKHEGEKGPKVFKKCRGKQNEKDKGRKQKKIER